MKTNETQWTPGPWTMKHGDGWAAVIGGDGHGEVCRLRRRPTNTHELTERVANLALLVHAPEMAELLAELTLDLTVPIMARGKCALLLAKVKGTTHA